MSEQRVVVMGLGNLLWADEGFGVRVAERLYAHYHWPEYVEIVDGGTQGLNLLGYVESASHLLILDAIDYGLEPGTLRTYAGERIPAYLSAKKMSLHQNSFSEVLALVRRRESCRNRIVTFFHLLLGELNNQNSVFSHQSH